MTLNEEEAGDTHLSFCLFFLSLVLSPKPEGCQKVQTPQKGSGAEITISQNANAALEMLWDQTVKVLN